MISNISFQDLWIIITALLVASGASVLGVFLVLRRMVMVGDAISHSMVLSIASVYIFTGSKSLLVLWPAALLIGLLSSYLVEKLSRNKLLSSDSAIGISFTVFFALGVVLISAFAGNVDLDLDCILFGEIALVPFDTSRLAGVPRATLSLLLVNLVALLFVFIGYRQLRCLTFDPLMAKLSGVKVNFWHYGLMAVLSVLVISAFEAVGAILVIGFLVLPANFALLFKRTLIFSIITALIFSWVCTLLAYYCALIFNLNIAATIVIVMAAVFFLFAFVRGLFLDLNFSKKLKKSLDRQI